MERWQWIDNPRRLAVENNPAAYVTFETARPLGDRAERMVRSGRRATVITNISGMDRPYCVVGSATIPTDPTAHPIDRLSQGGLSVNYEQNGAGFAISCDGWETNAELRDHLDHCERTGMRPRPHTWVRISGGQDGARPRPDDAIEVRHVNGSVWTTTVVFDTPSDAERAREDAAVLEVIGDRLEALSDSSDHLTMVGHGAGMVREYARQVRYYREPLTEVLRHEGVQS